MSAWAQISVSMMNGISKVQLISAKLRVLHVLPVAAWVSLRFSACPPPPYKNMPNGILAMLNYPQYE